MPPSLVSSPSTVRTQLCLENKMKYNKVKENMTNTCLQLSWQLMHSSVIYHGFFLCCVCTHTPIHTHTRQQCVQERDSSFCFFYLFFLPCGLLFFLSLLLWLSSLASDTRKLKLLFHLESVAKKIYGHPESLSPPLSLPISPVVWFLCHFYAHYFAFAACLSLALCLLSIYNHNNKNNEDLPFYCCCCTFVSLF